jgi:SAM-dependent methyltransferase
VSEKLYGELADWWPLLSAPADYEEEAAYFFGLLVAAADARPRTVLELGSGGGNTASHLKAQVRMTLVDRAPGMLAVSQRLNPTCVHAEGDMRTVRLGATFDGVFIHDAICYLLEPDDLRQALATAAVHCRPGGALVVAPDHTLESFEPGTAHGGHDGPDRGLRYLEWTHPREGGRYHVDYVYALREPGGTVRTVHDRHTGGLFGEQEWRALFEEAGFTCTTHTCPWGRTVFSGRRR